MSQIQIECFAFDTPVVDSPTWHGTSQRLLGWKEAKLFPFEGHYVLLDWGRCFLIRAQVPLYAGPVEVNFCLAPLIDTSGSARPCLYVMEPRDGTLTSQVFTWVPFRPHAAVELPRVRDALLWALQDAVVETIRDLAWEELSSADPQREQIFTLRVLRSARRRFSGSLEPHCETLALTNAEYFALASIEPVQENHHEVRR